MPVTLKDLEDDPFDERGVLKDGRTFHIRFTDSALSPLQRAVAEHFSDSWRGAARVTDASGQGGLALHKPGWRRLNDDVGDAAKEEAYQARDAWLVNAWRGSDAGEGAEGAACTVRNAQYPRDFGAPGHIKNGVCVPDKPRSRATAPAPTDAAKDAKDWARIREEMYSRYDLEASLAWQNLPWRNVR
jgi:hypothetical protein